MAAPTTKQKPTNGKTPMPKKKNRPAMATLEQRRLEQKKYFDVVLNDGTRLACKLVEFGIYHLLVSVDSDDIAGTILLPKHSIKFYVLDESVD